MAALYLLSKDELLRQLGVDESQGLADAEAARRLGEDGPNELQERDRKSGWSILWDQVAQVMVAVLAVSALLSLFLGDLKDTLAIAAILVLNIALGFRQESHAERAIAALARLATPSVRVRRNGSTRIIPAQDLVTGDIVLLDEGALIPADLRLLSTWALKTQEAALTGESEAVDKSADITPTAGASLAERTNCAFMGTHVATGRAEGVVVAIGSGTELGRVAGMLQQVVAEPTPLQKRLDRLGKQIAVAALAIVVVVLAVGAIRGEDPRLLVMTGISMAVAAVPEGLPAVVTITLALGAQRMLRRKALVRKLSAVETLGSVTVICADKTGTLTANRMAVTVLDAAGHRADLGPGQPSEPEWQRAREDPGLELLLVGGALCNDAMLPHATREGASPTGDPTEAALLVAASRAGVDVSELRDCLSRVEEVPFTSTRKCMTTIHQCCGSAPGAPLRAINSCGSEGNTGFVAFTKGAPETILALCNRAMVEGTVEDLTAGHKERIEQSNSQLAGNGMRVLALAIKPGVRLEDAPKAGEIESNMVFVGLIGLIDPPRSEVRDAVEKCRTAGIRPVMITGDHPLTAQFVAHELGIEGTGTFMTGSGLDAMSQRHLEEAVERVSVYARVSPEHKLRIVQALQSRGHIVAMTGDGVNDAPALKQAGIGIAMGAGGTDVSRAASDMVLLDDNFATIVAAVEEGRVINDNIRKFVRYQIGSNSSEIWVMLLAPLAGMPLPLLPLQILWVNLVTDGPPALALAVEPPDAQTMSRPPHLPDKPLFSPRAQASVVWAGLVMAASALIPGYLYWRGGQTQWQTVIFTTVVLSQMANALAVRSDRVSLFHNGIKSNVTLWAAVVATVALQILSIYTPLGNSVFHTAPLRLPDLAVVAVASSVVLWVSEIAKWSRRQRAGGTHESPPKERLTLSGMSSGPRAA